MAAGTRLLQQAAWLLCVLHGGQGQSNPADALPDFLTFPLQTVSASVQASDDLFTIVFIADSEPRMRANTNEEVQAYIDNLVAYKTSRVEYFAYGGGRQHRIDPQLVVLAGDISQDRSTSVEADAHLWQPLADNDIALIAGFGNHDWTGRSYDFSGDSWNAKATEFCRETYRNATRVASPYFGYREFGPADSRGPVAVVANFRGVQIVNFNSFLYQPSYHYDFQSAAGQQCATANALQGWAGCEVFSSAEPQIQQVEAALDADAGVTTLFVQHYPLTTQDVWWQDFNASGTSVAQKKDRLKGLIGRYRSSALLTGHNHQYAKIAHSEGFAEYIAPYFGGQGGADLNQGGGFLALLVSRTQGIVEVRHMPTPLYDPSRTTLPVATSPPTTTSAATSPADASILGSLTSKADAQVCMVANCVTEALLCAGDRECSGLASPLLASGGDQDPAYLVQLLWGLALAAPGNPAVRGVAACADRSCGSAILTRTTTSPSSPGLRGTTLPSGSTLPATTTWNPWVAPAPSGCPSRGRVSVRAAIAASAAMSGTLALRL